VGFVLTTDEVSADHRQNCTHRFWRVRVFGGIRFVAVSARTCTTHALLYESFRTTNLIVG
jgi:hypothetical protein